jgi:hypothetical protein
VLLLCLSGAVAAQPVPAGRDLIDRALRQLVPAPYQATIDAKVPMDTVLAWQAASDWMQALHASTTAAGLRVQPHFDAGRVDILPGLTRPRNSMPVTTAPSLSAPIPAAVNAATVSTLQPPALAHGPSALNSSDVASPTRLAEPAVTTFVLKPGQRIDVQFGEWSKREGWSLLWTSEKSWVLPGGSSVAYAGPVDVAIEAAVKDLYGNGVPVRLDIWEANKVMEVSHAK